MIEETEKTQNGRLFSILVFAPLLIFIAMKPSITKNDRAFLFIAGVLTLLTVGYAYIQTKNKIEVVIGLSAVIVAIKNNEPQVFIVRGAEHALPFGPFEPEHHLFVERGRRRCVAGADGCCAAVSSELVGMKNGRFPQPNYVIIP